MRKIAKYRLSVKGILRRHSKTICDTVVNQAAGSCSLNYSVSSELLSFRAARRRLSFGTTTTGVPEEDDVLSESDEGEDINNVDDHPDGGGGVAQAICTFAEFIQQFSVSTVDCYQMSQILSMAVVLQSMFAS